MISVVTPLRYDPRRKYYGSEPFAPHTRYFDTLINQEVIKEIIVVNHTVYEEDPQIDFIIQNYSTHPKVKIIDVRHGDFLFNQAWLLNIGIRHVSQPYFMRVDIDCIVCPEFSLRFKVIDLDDDHFVICTVFDASRYTKWDTFKIPEDMYDLVKKFKPRHLGYSHLIVKTDILRMIRGYDERFVVWGWEDCDLQERLEKLGLRELNDVFWFIHQSHTTIGSTGNGLTPEELKARNISYSVGMRDKSIIKNLYGWGRPSGPMNGG